MTLREKLCTFLRKPCTLSGAKGVNKHLSSPTRFYSSLDTFENEFHIDDVALQIHVRL